MTQARVLDLANRAGGKDAARVDETLGREVGKAQRVRALLLPAIRRLGTTYSLEMRAIDPGRDEHLFTLSDRATSKEGLLDLLDRLSERTRTELGEGKGDVGKASVQLGEAMTRSLEAYQHYVAGREGWLRDGLRAVALAEFEEALRLDPGFAPAHSDLADLLEEYGRPDLAAPHWRAADDNIGRMPAKERHVLLLRRASYTPSSQSWNRDEAGRLAEEAVVRFPSDKHVLFDAADAFDFLALREERDAALRRALELDPGYWAAAWRMSRRLGERTDEALEVARRAVATRRSAANLTLLAEALHAAGAGQEAAATAREALKSDGGRTSLVARQACFVLYQSGADAECQAVWNRMTSGGRNPLERDKASAELLESLFVRGRVREALGGLRSLEEPRRGEPGRLTYMLTIGHSRKLAPPEAVEQARRISNPIGRRNFLSWLGAKEEAERVDATLRERSAWGGVAQRIYEAVRLADAARYAEAAELMRAGYDAAQEYNAPTYVWSRAGFVAEMFLADGRAEEALRVQPPTLPCRCRDPVDYAASYPPFALVRARAMEQLGRRADAVRELDDVIAFWKEADHDLPLLVEAKAMRKRLAKAPASTRGTTATEAPAPSIAVLPFADMSPGKDQEYFTDGVAEEILDALTRVEGLKVIGRTSSFSFKGKKDGLRTIGRKLGASTVLEGSVRRDGARIRVTARLLKAEDGHRVWSETYERELGGLFAVQDEIAKAVVESLKVSLAPVSGPALRARRTGSPEAHNQYLLGLHFARQGSRDGFRRAEQAFRKAIALDPGYAPAQVGLASALVGRYNAGDSESAAETERLQKQSLAAAERAVQIAPDLAEAYQARGMTRRRFLWDWAAAQEDLDRALALDRNNAEALWNQGFQLAMLGRLREGIASLERATQVEPLSVEAWRWLGFVYLATGERVRARKALVRALEIAPEHDWALVFLAMDFLAEGQAASALETMERSRTEGWRLWGRALAHHALGNAGESQRAIDALIPMWAHVGTYQIAQIHAWRGDRDRAFEWLERCYRERDSGMTLAGLDPLVRGLRGDQRYGDLRRRMKLPVD
jgi:TolB-like protein/Flp pilus assembly protein TadD